MEGRNARGGRMLYRMRLSFSLLLAALAVGACGGEQMAPPPHGPEDTMTPIRAASARGIADAMALRNDLIIQFEPARHEVTLPGHRALQVAHLQAAALDQMEELMHRTLDGRSGACDENDSPLTGDATLDSFSDDLNELDAFLASRDDDLAPLSSPTAPNDTGLTPVAVHPGGTCRPGASLHKLVTKLRALSSAGNAYVASAESDQRRVVSDLSEISALMLDRSITAYEVYGQQ